MKYRCILKYKHFNCRKNNAKPHESMTRKTWKNAETRNNGSIRIENFEDIILVWGAFFT